MPKQEKELEDMKVWELERLYYLAKLKEMKDSIHKDHLYNEDLFSDSSNRVKINKRIQPVTIVDPATPDIPEQLSAVFQKMISTSTSDTAVDVLTITVPAGEIWEVYAVSIMGTCDATVANRTWILQIYEAITAASTSNHVIQTTAVTASASQSWGIYAGPYTLAHSATDNTVWALVANENILPVLLSATATIRTDNTAANSGAADVVGLRVYYKLVG